MIPIYGFLLIIAVALYAVASIIKPKNFPPGPKWYPFIGSSKILTEMTKKHGSQSKAFQELARQYSTKVLGLNSSGELIVVIFGKENLRHVFMESDFDSRPTNFFAKLRCLGKENMGITFANGPIWKIHRQFAAKNMRSVGFGKSVMETEIQSELSRMLHSIKKSNYKPISLKNLLAESVMNILWKYVAGERIGEDQLIYLLDLFRERSKAFSMVGGLLNIIPWCRYIVPDLSGYSLIKDINERISGIIEEAITKHKRKLVEGNDFIYSFLKEIGGGGPTFTEEQLKIVCLDFLIAGTQTTSNATEFALLRALKSPDMQDKIQKEIDAMLGGNVPNWSDTERLVYTSAYLHECQRYYTIVPLAGPRKVLKDTAVEGYTIPKNSTVLMSLTDMHFDKEIWGDPYVFRPERFIDERGMLKNSELIYPFGLGRRRCPGDALAKSFIFITFVGIMQKYRIVCPAAAAPSDEPIVGILSSPPPFTAQFKLRK